jgi:hypothetical protein
VIERHIEPDSTTTKLQTKLAFFVVDPHGAKVTYEPPSTTIEIPRSVLMRIDRAIPAPYRLIGKDWTDGEGRVFRSLRFLIATRLLRRTA